MRDLIFIISFLFSVTLSVEAKVANSAVQYTKHSPNEFTTIHVLIVDPKTTRIIAARALETSQPIATVSSIAKHFNAIAAINGGFFRINAQSSSNWVPAGILKIAHKWHGIAYKPRGSIGWDPDNGNVQFDILQTKSEVIINGQSMPISVMNKRASGDRIALFSDSYTDAINLTDKDCAAIMIAKRQVQAVYKAGDGNIRVPNGSYMVLGNLNDIKQGNSATVIIKTVSQLEKASNKAWDKMPFIVAGGPLLIHNNKKITDFTQEHMAADFINNRYARTAVGILADGRWVFTVVERGIIAETQGLSIYELRDFMYSLGCVAALNLDGGGSSAMYLRGNQSLTANERPVADAILVIEK